MFTIKLYPSDPWYHRLPFGTPTKEEFLSKVVKYREEHLVREKEFSIDTWCIEWIELDQNNDEIMHFVTECDMVKFQMGVL